MDLAKTGTREVEIERFCGSRWTACTDLMVREEPLEIRLDGHPIAVLMRTPGQDEELVKGFLITEGILNHLSQIRKIRSEENRMLIFLEDDVRVDLGRLSRNMFAGSSCGICGKATMEAVFQEFPELTHSLMPSTDVLLAAPSKMRNQQSNFERTGGVHAAGLFNMDGEITVLKEDIGRHNAVDKVIGAALGRGLDMSGQWLLVSGRVSFEIMQKSLAARISCVAAISAPSSLAVDFSKSSGQTLIGFLRPPTFNRYS
ncbi:formate dehydrogenase accessory sulfurtransferase FdhD [Luteolibacter algae]|uniref:Sulfur carrier protein FdhD n=1 Tax=Luteolibacter algae TaxID=454151 RepID=A0ABW5D887_9BACT